MKEKPYVKVAMYALNIIFAIIIIVPVIYCFNVSMMDLKEIYGGKFWPIAAVGVIISGAMALSEKRGR